MQDNKSVRVLIVENNYLVSEMVKGLLVKLGYTVVGKAADGTQAIKLTQELQPDVVIMDIKMPDMDGIEATQKIYDRQPTPVVMLTAFDDRELVERASVAGAGAYLIKPPKAAELARAITISMARFKDMMTLRQLNTELQAQNEELDSFAHTVAHDLKNPLQIIITYSEYLVKEVELEGMFQNALTVIAQSGRKMNNIIEALLLLAGVRKNDVAPEPLDMAEIIEEVQYRLAYMIEERQAIIEQPAVWPLALGYAPWIEEVWANYISNAIKYGGQPPRVQVGACETEHGQLRFWVRDNGAGLSPEEQTQLFIPFNRLNQVDIEGHGLGLSIVQRIVHKLGGQVGVESSVGQGSKFSFTLPRAEEVG